MITQKQAQEAKEQLLRWRRSLKPQLQTEISTEGLTNALLTAAEAEKRKEKDREILVWCHLLRFILGGSTVYLPKNTKFSYQTLFRIMSTKTHRWQVKRGVENFRSDEVPTQWMRDLYQKYLEWLADPPKGENDMQKYRYMEDKARAMVGGEKLPGEGLKNKNRKKKNA